MTNGNFFVTIMLVLLIWKGTFTMGKNSKAQDLEMRRQFQEKRKQEEEAKRRAQNRLMWQIIAGTLAIILLAVGDRKSVV